MKALVIGGGAREHALALRFASEGWQVVLAPGNPGIARSLTCEALNLADVPAATALARAHRPELTVVGPEAPLIAGLADALIADGLTAFGPSARAAQVEGSKAFAKTLMAEAGIPTAQHGVFDDLTDAARFAARFEGRVAVKADGIAAGKGVVVCADLPEAETAIRASLVEGAFGDAGKRIVVEERLFGPEVSLMAICDGRRAIPLPLSHDYKRVGDADTGPNTGGMGAVAPSVRAEPSAESLTALAITPLLEVMNARDSTFRGLLYAGLILTADGPRVLEYNCRFGDPETQALMRATSGPLAELLLAASRGTLPSGARLGSDGCAVGVVACAENYPHKPRLGDAIEGLKDAAATGATLCFAGVGEQAGELVTAGGRVLTAVGHGPDSEAARAQAYAAVGALRFRGMHYRHDIGLR